MARPGISFKQVADAAQALSDAGITPTIGAVRDALGGTGSPNTIHRHLSAWKESSAQPVTKRAELPARLVQAFQDELDKVATAAREKMQVELFTAQAEAVELARAGEKIEAERDSLAEQVELLSKERDVCEALEKKRDTEIESLRQEVKVQQIGAEDARTELAKAKLTIGGLLDKKQELNTEIAELKKNLAMTIEEGRKALQGIAVMEAELKAAERRANEADAREKATASKLERAESEVRQERDEVTQSRMHNQRLQTALDAAAKKLD